MRTFSISKAQQTVDAAHHLQEEKGLPPTRRELAAYLGVSQCAVHSRLHNAERAGLIAIVPRKARGIIILGGSK